MSHRRNAPQDQAATARPLSGPLGRLARAAFCRRRRVVLAWVAALVVAFALSGSFSGSFDADYSAPGSDSSAAQELLEQHFVGSESVAATFVVHAPDQIDSPTAQAQIAALRSRIAAVPHVSHVGDPNSGSGVRSANGTAVLFDAVLDVDTPEQLPKQDAKALIDAAQAATNDGFSVAVRGDVILLTQSAEIGSERIGLAAAAVVLLLTFGSVIAAGLPILIAVVGLAASVLLTTVVAAALPVPDWSTSLVAMMVLGVGIDYTLLMVTRFREWRGHGLSVEDATVATLDTAGRSVLLAGTTVIISMSGLAGIGLSFMRGAAVVTIVGIVVVLTATMTLFPALLGYFGPSVDRLRLPLPRRRNAVPGVGWFRWSRLIQRFRYVAVAIGVVVMAALAAPFLNAQFGTPDAGNHPAGTATRAAHDLTAQAFGPGANGRLLVVVDHATGASTASVSRSLASTDGIASTSPALTSTDGQVALITAVPDTGPQDELTADLVERLRDSVLPAAVAGTGSTTHVGGTTAATLDSDANVVRRIPLLLTMVVGISLLLLLAAFRSVAIAAKAAALNLMSVAAAYGVVAFVLQGGWAGQLVGIDSPTPLPAFVPVLMFAVLFSLSADYEIFLVSRMRDAYTRTGNTGDAIVAGLAGTARVITAAAAVMIAVFAAFVPSTDVAVKVIGVGMAAAILIDATVVRMLLVPSIMHILGERNWWMPAWLERRLPELSVEGYEQDYLPPATTEPLTHLRTAPALAHH